MRSLILATGHLLLLIIIIKVFVAPELLTAQGQHFVDETTLRLPEREDESSDGALGDIDSDGDVDIVVATWEGFYRSYLLYNDGMGYFPGDSLQNLFNRVYDFTAVAMGDIERDEDYDLIFTAFGEKIKLLTQNDEGIFVDESDSRLPGHIGASATDGVFIDVDGNLSLDISIAEYGYNRLWINNGNGFYNFSPRDRFPSGIYNSNSLAWGDVDGDFDLDCVIANNTGHTNMLLINDGAGWFSDETAERLPEDLSQSNDVVLVDIDGDSDLDIIIANGWFPGYNKVWINNGNGYFEDESELRIPQYSNASSGVAFGDIDNDGDMDLLIANRSAGGDANKVFVNNGNGYLTDETEERYPNLDDETNMIRLGDVDSDGDMDCYVVNVGEFPYGQQNRLLINNSTSDSFPPNIPRTFHHPDTGDTTNPYLITTTVWDNISVVIGELKVSLFYRSMSEINDADFTEIPMLDCGGFLYRENIPAQSSVSTVEYYIKAEDRMGNFSFDPPNAPDSVFSFVVDVSLGINNNPNLSPNLPKTFSLSQNYPNPFNPSTTIDYSIPEGEAVNVTMLIYNMRGRLIRALINEEKNPGSYSVYWDGRSNEGREAGSGVYLYRIEAGSFVSIKKMIITR